MERTLIVGLGNPGPRYSGTRHNIGFDIVEALARELGVSLDREKFKGRYASAQYKGRPVLLLTPHTFMNLSGQSVSAAAQFFQIPRERILVVHDELEFPFARLRLKSGGGHAGHNGLRSIIERCGGRDFLRLRVGISRPKHGAVSDYVLAPFSKEEKITLPDLIDDGVRALQLFLEEGLTAAMNTLHGAEAQKKKSHSQ